MTTHVKSGASLATAAALLALAFAAAAPVHADDAGRDEPGRCYGVNQCKGQSLCATARHDCKGLNDCKGQGVLVKTRSACLAAGGTLTEPK